MAPDQNTRPIQSTQKLMPMDVDEIGIIALYMHPLCRFRVVPMRLLLIVYGKRSSEAEGKQCGLLVCLVSTLEVLGGVDDSL